MTTTKRVPKLGEIWTAADGTPLTCIDDEADKIGRYGWSRAVLARRRQRVQGLPHHRQPHPTPEPATPREQRRQIADEEDDQV